MGHICPPFSSSKQGRRGCELGEDLVHCALVVLQVTDDVGVGDGALGEEGGAPVSTGAHFGTGHSLTGTDGRGDGGSETGVLAARGLYGNILMTFVAFFHQSQHGVNRVGQGRGSPIA